MPLPTIHHPAVGRTPQPNYTHVTVGDLTIAFSYTTPIGFHYPGRGWTVRENVWGPTTGRHLNHLDDGTPDAVLVCRRGAAQGLKRLTAKLKAGKATGVFA